MLRSNFISKSGLSIGTINWSTFIGLLIAVACCWHLLYVRLNADNWKYVVRSDGAGYYAYLPATFIYHDLTYQFAEEKSKTYRCGDGCDVHFFGSRTLQGKRINKYFIGTSILEFPFFITAYTIATVFDYPTDGYSFPFQLLICLAAIFYLLAGLYFLRKLLIGLHFHDSTIALVILLIFFGTNLYHYSLEEPSMSHVFSFGAISFFLWKAFQLSQAYARGKFISFTVVLAIIILIRPANGVILLMLPFFFSDFTCIRKFFTEMFRDKIGVLLSIILFLFLFFLQSLAWKLTTGNWLEDSYVGEKLTLAHPHFQTILFGWRKGLFIYTPILLVSLMGLFFIRPYKRALFLFVFLFVNAWIISCWHDLAYGGSLGMRPFVDTYPVFAIPLGFLIQSLKGKIRMLIFLVVLSPLVVLNLFQHYQYHSGILPYDEMNWYKYKKIFGRSEKVYAGIFTPGADKIGYLPEHCKLISSFKRTFENDSLFQNRVAVVKGQVNFSPPYSVRLDDSVKFCADNFIGIYYAVPESLFTKTWVTAKAKVWLTDLGSNAKMVFAFKDNDKTYYWNAFYLVHRIDKTKTWCDYSFSIPLPHPESKGELLSVYVMKDDNSLMYVDDIEISFWKSP